MNLIVAVDKNWAIGNKNRLLTRIPGDQRFFRQVTVGNVVVLGRKTLETFPQGKPLAERTNIILSSDPDYRVKGACVVHGMEELKEELSKYPSESVYVIGGESIYRQLLPLCDTAHVTRINYEFEADSYFPNLDRMQEWELTADSEEQSYFDLEYVFCKYQRKNADI